MDKNKLKRLKKKQAHHKIVPTGKQNERQKTEKELEKERKKGPQLEKLELPPLKDTRWPVAIDGTVLKNVVPVYANEATKILKRNSFDPKQLAIVFRTAQEFLMFVKGTLNQTEIPPNSCQLCDEMPKRGAFMALVKMQGLRGIRSDSLPPSMCVEKRGLGVNRLKALKEMKGTEKDFNEMGLPYLDLSKDFKWVPNTGFTIDTLSYGVPNLDQPIVLRQKDAIPLLPPTTPSDIPDCCFTLLNADDIKRPEQLTILWRNNVITFMENNEPKESEPKPEGNKQQEAEEKLNPGLQCVCEDGRDMIDFTLKCDRHTETFIDTFYRKFIKQEDDDEEDDDNDDIEEPVGPIHEKEEFLHYNPTVAFKIRNISEIENIARAISTEAIITAGLCLDSTRVGAMIKALNASRMNVQKRGGTLVFNKFNFYAIYPHQPLINAEAQNGVDLNVYEKRRQAFQKASTSVMCKTLLKVMACLVVFLVLYGLLVSLFLPSLINFDFSGGSTTGDGPLWVEESPYEVLGVSTNASTSEIKKAYHKLSKEFHPDRCIAAQKDDNPGTDLEEIEKECSRQFIKIAESYKVLSNREEREYYDNYGTQRNEKAEAPGKEETIVRPFHRVF